MTEGYTHYLNTEKYGDWQLAQSVGVTFCTRMKFSQSLNLVIDNWHAETRLSSSSTTVGSTSVGVWRHCYYRCPPLPI